ncbi:MAG: hypothetical protein QOI82_3060 [Actinomycetota bacterium]|jgi:hypothetical protein|nr:hypothetical protein [Actinomycetota bacterium]
MKASRKWSVAVAGGLGLAPLLLLSAVGSAWADAPSKSGWWNALSGGGAALPVPTTGADDLHVSQGPNGPAAYAAVAYDVLGQTVTAATLELKVVANSTVGTIDLMACPTKDSSWKAGGDQPMDAAPQYDCAKGVVGASDGTTVTFFLDAPALGSTGYSIAIAPSAGALPFSVDFAKPDASSLTLQVEAPPVEPGPVAAPPAPAPPAAGNAGTASLGAVTAPVAPVVPQQAPAVAAPAVPAPQAAAAPVPFTAAAQRTPPVSNRERYAAGTMLALLAGLLVWAFQQPAPTPRLIGGMARKSAPEVVPVDVRPRGIGRFASMRTAPARPLL